MRRALILALGTALAAGCATSGRTALSTERLTTIWREPTDLEQRDLFYGPGGAERAPKLDQPFEFLEVKPSGVNPGYDVKDASGQRWSVKLGVEARTEIVMSRIVWAVGYHQPFIYFVPQWTLTHEGKDSLQGRSRFRLEPPTHDKKGEWSWRKNPFLGTRELSGLFVLMVLFNNWDLKTPQNARYEVAENGSPAETWYMVRDLGASLGRSAWLTFGTKDDPEGFEAEPFIVGVEGNRVRFGFEGGWMEPQLHSSVTPADVRWICGLLARLTEKQWDDAFRAGGYSAAEAQRFIKRLREKVNEGLNLR
ncbi:MAG TPA: hypothetical protein VJ717_00065 [Gemmatimonadaceae bacterium]|nr:hypothetical protein [Gemmatimonadaceae bacterium]